MKRYNYKTNKIYESVTVYRLSLDEFDDDEKLIGSKDFEDTYSTFKDAIEDAYEIMTNIAKNDNIDDDDVDCEENGNSVVFTVDGVGKWVFTVVSSTEESFVEHGNADVSESSIRKNVSRKSNKIYESAHTYTIRITENPDVEDFDLEKDTKPIEGSFDTIEDAIEFALDDCGKSCVLFGISLDDVEYDVMREKDMGYGSEGNPECNVVAEVYLKSNKDGHSWKYYVIDGEDLVVYDNDDTNVLVNESVAERFAKLRKMFESEEDEKDEDKSEDEIDDAESDEDENAESGEKEDDEKEDEDQDEEMKAVIISVKKGDEDKCKEELIDAGISEDDIEILEADEDAENVDIRIDVNSVMELKDYLAKKGIDLEEEIGGEIVSDEDDSEDKDEDDSDEDKDEEDEEKIDFENLGDIFGAEDDEDEK